MRCSHVPCCWRNVDGIRLGDLDELTAIHKGLFEGVFEDAGKLRTSNTTREVTNDRARAANPEAFFPAGLIETGAHNIAMELADKRNLHALDCDVFVSRICFYL